MERSEEEHSSDSQRSVSLEMTPKDMHDDSEKDVTQKTSKISSDTECQSFPVCESYQSLTICQDSGRNWSDSPLTTVSSPHTTVKSLLVRLPTPTSQSSASVVHSGAGSPPERILPLTKRSKRLLMSCDVTEPTSAAPAASVAGVKPSQRDDHNTYMRTWQRYMTQWIPSTGQQPALIPVSSGALASDFTKSPEVGTSTVSYASFATDFPPDISTPAAIPGGNIKSLTTLEAVQSSSTASMDLYNFGLVASGSSGFSSEGFHETRRPRVADITVFHPSVLPSSESEPESASVYGVPYSHALHMSHVHSLQSVAEPELVEPLSSLHIDADDTARTSRPMKPRRRSSRASVGGKSLGSRTYPGCSTLRYNRKYNPGRYRPRTYKCDRPGQFFALIQHILK